MAYGLLDIIARPLKVAGMTRVWPCKKSMLAEVRTRRMKPLIFRISKGALRLSVRKMNASSLELSNSSCSLYALLSHVVALSVTHKPKVGLYSQKLS